MDRRRLKTDGHRRRTRSPPPSRGQVKRSPARTGSPSCYGTRPNPITHQGRRNKVVPVAKKKRRRATPPQPTRKRRKKDEEPARPRRRRHSDQRRPSSFTKHRASSARRHRPLQPAQTLLAVTPARPRTEQTREVTRRFAGRAYPQPATDAENASIVKWSTPPREPRREVGGRRADGHPGVGLAKFLFRLEMDDRPEGDAPAPLNTTTNSRSATVVLHSGRRCRMPELSRMAAQWAVVRPARAAGPAGAMSRDTKAKSLVEQLRHAVLAIRRLAPVAPTQVFPASTSAPQAMENTHRDRVFYFRRSSARKQRPDPAQNSDFTVMNRTLARHYGYRHSRQHLRTSARPGRKRRLQNETSSRQPAPVGGGCEQRGRCATQARY